MFVWDTILAFGMKNWKLIAIILAIVSLISYIGILRWEVDHYKDKYAQEHTSFLQYKSLAEKKQADLEAGSKQLTKLYAEQGAAYYSLLDKQGTDLKERIKNDKELNALRVSNRVLRLLNESTRAPREQVVTGAVVFDDAEAHTPQGSTTLAIVFDTMVENNKNHLVCIKQVELWQSFWINYKALVEGVERDASP